MPVSNTSFVAVVLLVTAIAVCFLPATSADGGSSFWETYDKRFRPQIEKELQAVLAERETREILGHFDDVVKTEKLADYPPLQTPVGMTFNWLRGTFPRQGIAFNNKLRQTFHYNNQYWSIPDELFALYTPMVEATEEITIASTLSEFQSSYATRYGISVGYGPIALGLSKEVGNARTSFTSISVRIAETFKRATEFQAQLLPSNFVKLDPTIVGLLTTLPRYDASTKQLYFNLFDDIGVGVITSATMGGEKYMKQVIETKTTGSNSKQWIETQVHFVFQALSEKNATKRKEWESKIDPSFKTSTTTETKRVGGDITISFERDDLWLPTIPGNPAPLRYQLSLFYEWFPEGQLRDDLKQAAVDYLTSYIQPDLSPFLGRSFAVGKKAQGSSISVSSCREDCHTECKVRVLGICLSTRRVCVKSCGQESLIDQKNGKHQFHKDDKDQYVKVKLGATHYIKQITASVSPVGQQGPVSLVNIQTSLDDSTWTPFGSKSSVTDGSVDFTHAYPTRARYILYKFGSSNGVGSIVYSVNAFAVNESRPLGFLQSITDTNAIGWAFDPLDPLKELTITLSIKSPDGKVTEVNGKTGVAAPDIVKKYNLPSGAKPGFNIAYKLPVPSSRKPTKYTVQATWKGLQQQGSSSPQTVWWHRPPGRLITATPSYVEGWVYVPGKPNVLVTVYVNGKEAGNGTTNIRNDHVNKIFKVNGNFGFRIPIRLKGARVHTITASVTLDDGIPIQLEDTLEVDLRYPLGDVEVVTPSRIAGWAVDPNNPDEPTEVQVYIDQNFFCKATTNITRKDINSLYVVEGTHGFDIPVRVEGGKIHTIDVYVRVEGKLLTQIVSKVISLPIDDHGSQPVNNPIVNNFLVGIDASNGEFRLRVGDLTFAKGKVLQHEDWRNTSYYNAAIPDQMSITFNSEDITRNTTEVFNNTSEYLKYRMKQSGWGISLFFISFGHSTRTVELEHKFQTSESRIGFYEREISIATVRALPNQLLNYTAYARSLIDALPPYNPRTRAQYFKVFQLLGTDYLTSYNIGGLLTMETYFETSFLNHATYWEQTRQTSIGFTFFISVTGSHAKKEASLAIDQTFLKKSKWNFIRQGGTPEFALDQYDQWLTTIRERPAVVSYKVAPIHDLCHHDPQKKEWLAQARLDYLRMQTPEHLLCARINVAVPSEGAQVIRYSSMAQGQNENALVNILSDPKQRKPATPAGETDFTFADGDPQQSLVIDLGFVRAIKTIAVDLTPYPKAHAVWDYVQVQASKDDKTWFEWAMVGDKNGVAEITKDHYEFPSLVPMEIRYIRLHFGAGKPEGGRIRRVYAYLCEL